MSDILVLHGLQLKEAAGGLTNFVESEYVAAPNDTVNVSAISVVSATTNADAALIPKGTGAHLAHSPDNTIAGGNKRGEYATDWQKRRSLNTQVASGRSCVISGGEYNTASGSYSTISGGYLNTASGSSSAIGGGDGNTASKLRASVGGGYANTASGDACYIGGGRANTASGNYSTISGGYANTTSGNYSTVSGGSNHTASGIYSWIPGGNQATTRGLFGAGAYSAKQRAALGDSQVILQPVRRTTASTSVIKLTANGSSETSSTVMVLPNNSGAAFVAIVTAYQPSTGDVGGWKIEGTVKRGANAAATALQGTPTTTILGGTIGAGLGSPTVTVTVDTTLGACVITITPGNATSTYWTGKLELMQAA